MERAEIDRRIALVLADQLGLPVEEFTPGKRMVVDLGFDSLDSVEALMNIEDEFDLIIDDADADKCITLSDCAALVQRLLPTPACANHEAG